MNQDDAAPPEMNRSLLEEIKRAKPSWMADGVSIVPERTTSIPTRTVTQPERPASDITRKAGYAQPYGPINSGGGAGTDGGGAVTEVVFISGALFTENVITDGSDPVPIP